MTLCDNCKKEYHSVSTCSFAYVSIEGKVYRRIGGYVKGRDFKKELKDNPEEEKCFDCGISLGRIHHYGCGEEECPVCHDKLATCECDDVEIRERA